MDTKIINLSIRDLLNAFPFDASISTTVFFDRVVVLNSDSLNEYLSYYPNYDILCNLPNQDLDITSTERKKIMKALNTTYEIPGFFKKNGTIYYQLNTPNVVFNLDSLKYEDFISCCLINFLCQIVQTKEDNQQHWKILCDYLLDARVRKKLFFLLKKARFLEKSYIKLLGGFIYNFKSKQLNIDSLKDYRPPRPYPKVFIFDILYYIGLESSFAHKLAEDYVLKNDFNLIMNSLRKLKQNQAQEIDH